ncbi:hypothetical protein BGZ59_007017 [Podila verticillata]|nr:hypothetical protein BGZ59_007017 [Podila verticillata]
MPSSLSDTFLESNCIPDLWRFRLGQSAAWNLTDSTWEAVQAKDMLPPVSGLGLKTLLVPGNHSAHITNGTVAHADNISPFMIEFGRSGCANQGQEGASTPGLSGIAFNIYNPVMNTWQVKDLVNISETLTPPATSGLNATALTGLGNWLSPVVAVDYVALAWYIILQSTVPLRQLILKKDVSALTSFMGKIDLTESSSTLFPDELLFEGWETISDLNETAPFVGRGVATMMRDSIVIISGTANSFTPGDANIAELRGCDHAYLFSTVDHTWKRQELMANNGVFPETREKAAFIAGSNVGRNIPIEGVLPIMAYNTNSSAWTNTIRATLDVETTFISNVTRAAIIIGTVVFGAVLVVVALSTHFLRKWNQRNYTKVDAFQLEQQKSRKNGTPELPSILKKRYLAESQDATGRKANRGTRRVRGLQAEVIFERGEFSDEEIDDDEEDDGFGADDEGDHEVQKVSLLSRAQPSARSPSRQRVEEAYVDDVDQDDTEEDEEDGSVIVRLPIEK